MEKRTLVRQWFTTLAYTLFAGAECFEVGRSLWDDVIVLSMVSLMPGIRK